MCGQAGAEERLSLALRLPKHAHALVLRNIAPPKTAFLCVQGYFNTVLQVHSFVITCQRTTQKKALSFTAK